MEFFSEKKIGGMIAIIFGIVSLYEAANLYTYSLNLLTGDHALPGLIGIFLILFGISMFFKKSTDQTVDFPTGKLLYTMIVSVMLLFFYSFLITILGYLLSTLTIAVLLIKLIAKKSWIFSVMLGGVITAILYYIFIVLLKTPFPIGIFSL
jgi:putative tricarboxylic transport membrane protein